MLEADPKAEGQQGDLYEKDFYAWTQEQANLLRHHQWHQLDLDNLIEEIDSLGKQVRRELKNRLIVLIQHLLKWEYQPERRSSSWRNTIEDQRVEITDLLEESPSLSPQLDEILDKAYPRGVNLAVRETNLAKQTFPPACPYSIAELLNDRFYPGAPSDSLETDD